MASQEATQSADAPEVEGAASPAPTELDTQSPDGGAEAAELSQPMDDASWELYRAALINDIISNDLLAWRKLEAQRAAAAGAHGGADVSGRGESTEPLLPILEDSGATQ